jgi:glyoxylase-like metal-dependent hydrolase (beta-lactamase superfamily II)
MKFNEKCNILRYPMKYMNANMYIVIENDSALLIDPNENQEAVGCLMKNHIKEVTILLTHEHFDHTSGVPFFQKILPSIVVCQKRCAQSIEIPRKNRPLALLKMQVADYKEMRSFYNSFKPYSIVADIVFEHNFDMEWQGHNIHIISQQGHSPGSVLIELDHKYVFTGDYMIQDTPVILRYPGGSKEDYTQFTLPYLLAMPADRVILPGHGKTYIRSSVEYIEDMFAHKE